MQALTLKKRQKKFYLVTALLFLLLALFLWLNIITGTEGIKLSKTALLFDGIDDRFDFVVEQIRLPRAVAAILVGALLGLSGAVMQGVLKNPLASPFTLGISQAAAFGASFAIIVLQAYSIQTYLSSSISIALCAFVASLICMMIILFLGSVSSLSPSSMILAGVALGSLFSAMTMFIQYFADDLDIAATLFWTFGELGKADWSSIKIMAIVFFPIFLYFIFSHWKMDAMSFGDESAQSKGVDIFRFRFISLLLSSLLCAIAVSFVGIIGFVGLVAPHFVRLLVGENHFALITLSALSGATLLLVADLVSKLILTPIILPIGILTSFMGVPLFLYLLARKGKY